MWRYCILTLSIFLFCSTSTHCQIRTYIYAGTEAAIFRQTKPILIIIDDFNAHHHEFDQSNNKLLITPKFISGGLLGTKIHSRRNEFGGNIQYMRYLTSSRGINSEGGNYFQTLTIAHNGICINYVINLINTNYFRTGPGVSINIEQYKFKIKTEYDSDFTTQTPINRAVFTSKLNYKISIGGPKFNIDIIAFYKLPLHTLNLDKLNQDLNFGYASEYNNGELVFSPVTYGFTLCVCFGSKENYDF
ncbi:MAG: hypothetical protein PHP52_06650 [Bacteroidales bacterium]|nr:hypothetical protein [Bacteroidales bacterium]MDD4217225.1 hypothetical protein [Bacteroidales bacterium]MDY0141072.1 hypothetical protein [Bacteroidales bacterium]